MTEPEQVQQGVDVNVIVQRLANDFSAAETQLRIQVAVLSEQLKQARDEIRILVAAKLPATESA